jgi:uncharacterized protein
MSHCFPTDWPEEAGVGFPSLYLSETTAWHGSWGLSRSQLQQRLAFKGGTAIKRCYFGDYRFSEDLDFTLIQEVPFDTIRSELDPIFDDVQRNSGIVMRYSRQDHQSHANSHTFYLAYEGPLPTQSPKEVKVDITIREHLVLPLLDRPVVRGYDEYDDLPDGAVVRAYSLHEIAVEKIVALGDPVRNEPRDLYDVWYLTTEGHVDISRLNAEIEAKLKFRGRTLPALAEEFLKKRPRLGRLWSARLAAQMAYLPKFEGVYRSVQRSFRQAGLMG